MPHLRTTVVLLILTGILYRLWPIAAGMPNLWSFFLTEDGYLMLTVSRNMAIGNGMSVSDGTIATNGVQPMIAFLFSLPYLATSGDKVTSLIGIHLIHTGIAFAALFAIRAFAARILAPRDVSPVWPWAAALLWFLAPLLLRHSMNGLETGLYTLVLILTLLVFARVLDTGETATAGQRLGLGVMCGLAVLARNDAVFLVAAIFLTWAGVTLFVHRQSFTTMLVRLVPPGLLSIAVAAPWLINNKLRFGSIVPVSGTAQSAGAEFGQNAPLLPAKLFENAFPMLPLPGGLETNPTVMGIATLGVALGMLLFLIRILRHGTSTARTITFAFLLYGTALAFYYGFLFGAAHFLSRYLAPLAPLMIIAALAASLELGRFLIRKYPEALAWVYAGGGITLSLVLLTRALFPGVTLQGHEQVVAWTQENVPPETWVGAVQTGTLGYWHDRTYNLDGKVNPEALATRLQEGHVLNYVVDSEIDYVIDWAGVGDWVNFEVAQNSFADAFELIVQDYEANLSIMRRRSP